MGLLGSQSPLFLPISRNFDFLKSKTMINRFIWTCLLSYLSQFWLFDKIISILLLNTIGTMRVPEGDLHCQCKLSIFSLSSFGPCIVFWILQKGTCIGKCIFSIFPAVTHQLKCKQTCIEKCRPRHKISMKKWLKIHQISKNVNLFPYITTNLHW